MITEKKVMFNDLVRTAGKDMIKEMSQGESVVNMTGRTEPAELNRVSHVFFVENSLTLVSILCGNDHKISFSENNCVVKKNGTEIAISKRTCGT